MWPTIILFCIGALIIPSFAIPTGEVISKSNFTLLGTIGSSKTKLSQQSLWVSNFGSSWSEAFSYCYQISGVLVSIPTHILDENIRQNFISKGLLNRLHWTSGRLTEISPGSATEQFVWAGNGQPVSYFNWAIGQPAPHCGGDVCIAIKSEGYLATQFGWHTEKCNTNYNFICVL